MGQIKSEDIDFVLSDVEPEHYFIAKNGEQIKNMKELAEKINSMDDETFSHHANQERNDFSNWIQDIIKDKELAQEIVGKDKQESARKIESKIKRLNKVKQHLELIEKHEKEAYNELQKTIKTNDRNPIYDYAYGIIIGVVTGILLGSLL